MNLKTLPPRPWHGPDVLPMVPAFQGLHSASSGAAAKPVTQAARCHGYGGTVKQRVVTGTNLYFALLSSRRGGLGGVAGTPVGEPQMTHLVRLDLERIRRNLEAREGSPQTDDDVMRLLAGMKVWRKDAQWFCASAAAVSSFLTGEVLERISA